MPLDREYQLELLKMLSEAYPDELDHREFCRNMDEQTEKKYGVFRV
jgi:hypothetical protein